MKTAIVRQYNVKLFSSVNLQVLQPPNQVKTTKTELLQPRRRSRSLVHLKLLGANVGDIPNRGISDMDIFQYTRVAHFS